MRVLITGAGGFIGARLDAAFRRRGHEVRRLIRTRQPGPTPDRTVVGDLLTIDTDRLVAGCDLVVHAASRTAGSAEQLWRSNVDATSRLIGAVAKHGCALIYVSTTGVYGRSSGHLGTPETMRRHPSSTLSIARAAAEDLVHEADGTTVRPHIVFGDGDRWVVPPLVALMQAANAWVGGSGITVAGIAVDRLADGIAGLAGHTLPPALHAAELRPVRLSDRLQVEFERRGLHLPRRVLTVEEAHALAPTTSRNALEMIGQNSSIDATSFWQLTSGPTEEHRAPFGPWLRPPRSLATGAFVGPAGTLDRDSHRVTA